MQGQILGSFYRTIPFRTKQLLMWYLFKHKYSRLTARKIKKFPQTGVLSSHFVHLVSKKNFTYQNWSKYKSRQLNMNRLRSYVYLCTTLMYSYIMTINTNMYFFTKSLDKYRMHVDEDFNTSLLPWYTVYKTNIKGITGLSNYSRYFLNNPIAINHTDYDHKTIYEIHKNLPKILEFLNETDASKKEQLYNTIQNILTYKTATIAFTASQQLITTKSVYLLPKALLANICQYYNVYRI